MDYPVNTSETKIDNYTFSVIADLVYYLYEFEIPAFLDSDDDRIERLELNVRFKNKENAVFKIFDNNFSQNQYGFEFTNLKGFYIKGSLHTFLLNNNHLMNEIQDEGIYVQDELIFDDFLIETNLLVSPGGVIRVPKRNLINNLNESSLINCEINPCNEMWKGIIVEEGAFIYISGGIIKNAEVGIKIEKEGSVTGGLEGFPPLNIPDEDGLNIRNCIIGIQSDLGRIDLFRSTILVIDNEWRPYYPNQQLIREGIKGNIGCNISNGSMIRTLYSAIGGYHCGIKSNNSNISLRGSEIRDFPAINNTLKEHYGCGIFATGNSTNEIQTSEYTSNIKNGVFGIKNRGNSLNLDKLFTDKVMTGINVENSEGFVSITNSTINSFVTGIDIYNQIGGSIYIRERVIINLKEETSLLYPPPLVNYVHSGIQILNCPSTGSIIIRDNIINLNDITSIGVNFVNNTKGWVINNRVNLKNNNQIGINFINPTWSGLGSNRISCNRVIGDNAHQNNIGINLESISTAYVSCNGVHDNEHGIEFSGPAMGTDFTDNTMEGGIGLLINEGSFISKKLHRGNCWDVMTQRDAVNLNTDGFMVEQSEFRVDQVENPCYLPNWTANSGTNWFANEELTSLSAKCPTATTQSECFGQFDPLVGSPVCDFGIFNPSINQILILLSDGDNRQWNTDYQSFNTLSTISNCSNWPFSINQFYNSHVNSDIGKLHSIGQDIMTIPDSYSSHTNTLIILKSELDLINTEITTLMQAEYTEAIEWQLDNLYAQKDAKMSQMSNVRTQIDNLRTNGFTSIQDEISGMILTTENGAWLKSVLNIYINQLKEKKSQPSALESNILTPIANLCPEIGCKATYLARAILSRSSDSYTNFENSCQPPILPLISSTHNLEEINKVTLSPNPTSSELWYKWNGNSEFVSYSIINQDGRELKKVKTGKNSDVIITNDLVSGTYILKLELQFGRIVNTLFVISPK